MNLLENSSPITYVVLLTFVLGIIFLKKVKNNFLLLGILFFSLFTEITTIIFIYYSLDFSIIYNVSFIIHFVLWLLILMNNNTEFEFLKKALYFFLLFSLINFTFIEKQNLNYYTFIVGTMLYVISFIYISFYQLKMEKLVYFTNNSYVLQASPILFFVGLTFLFAFRNYGLRHLLIVGKIDVYTFISTIVNVTYYGLINSYIFKERKQKNA